MDPEMIKLLVSTGVGGILGALCMTWKRGDDQRYQATLKEYGDRLITIVEANTNALRSLQVATETAASIRTLENKIAALEKHNE